MSIAFIILIIVLVFWPWISRFISRMVSQFMANRAEDMMRRMMGMPSRKEERRRRKSRESDHAAHGDSRNGNYGSADGAKRYHRAPRQSAGSLLRSVAEDAEYTEVVEFDAADIGAHASARPVCEEQVSDVEYTEYKS